MEDCIVCICWWKTTLFNLTNLMSLNRPGHRDSLDFEPGSLKGEFVRIAPARDRLAEVQCESIAS